MATKWAFNDDLTLPDLGDEPQLHGDAAADPSPKLPSWDERVPLGAPIPLPDSVLREPMLADPEVSGEISETLEVPRSYRHDTVTPPERVRFAAPLEIRLEGKDRIHDGAVVNLSVHGLACLAPTDIACDERVWASFRLNLADKPLTLLCQVIWKRPPEHDHWVYGLRFLSLTRKEADRLREVVRERTEGRAGEWPLPMMPAPFDDVEVASAPRAASPWLTAAAGMAAGIGLALCLSVIPTVSIGGPMPLSSVSGVAATPATTAVPTQVVSSAAGVRPELAGAVAVAPNPEPASEPEAKPVVAALAPSQPDPVASALLPRREPLPAKQDGILRPLGGDDTMPIALLTDGPVDQHVAFWLEDPKRLVIDVIGRRSGFTKHVYTIDHPLASRLRVGNHPGKVRFVIEVSDDVQSDVETQPRDGSLFLELRRRSG